MWPMTWWVASAFATECPDAPGREAPPPDDLVGLLGRPANDPAVAALSKCWKRIGPRSKPPAGDYGAFGLYVGWHPSAGGEVVTGLGWPAGGDFPFGLPRGDGAVAALDTLGIAGPFVPGTSEFDRTLHVNGGERQLRLTLSGDTLWRVAVRLPERAPPAPTTCAGAPWPDLAGFVGQPLEAARAGLADCARLELRSTDPVFGEEWRGAEFGLWVLDGVVHLLDVDAGFGGTPPAGLPVQGDLGTLVRALPGGAVSCVATEDGTGSCEVRSAAWVVTVDPDAFEDYDRFWLRRGNGAAPAPRAAPVAAAPTAPKAAPPAAVAAVAAPLPSLEDAVARTTQKASHDAAVAIGLEDYPFLRATVPYATRDAAAFADLATFTLGVPGERVITLTRGAREQILDAVRKAGAAAGPGGTVWVFFAGHGAGHPSTGERMLLGDDTRADPIGFAARGVLLSELEREASANGAQPMLVLDACYTGAGRDGASFLGGARFAIPTYAAVTGAQWNAAAADQFASPLEPVRHGAFSYFAIGALRGWADGVVDGVRDGQVTAGEAQTYVTGMLRRQGLAQQTPVWVGDPARVLSRGTEVGPTF